MNIVSSAIRRFVPIAASVLLVASGAGAEEIKVMTSGGFAAAYLEIVPEFERATQHAIVSAFGASMGGAPDSIPSRLRRGEPVDVVILAGSALDALIEQGKVVAGSRVDLVRSTIGTHFSPFPSLQRPVVSSGSEAISRASPGSLQSIEELRVLRDDGCGFLPHVTDIVHQRSAMTVVCFRQSSRASHARGEAGAATLPQVEEA